MNDFLLFLLGSLFILLLLILNEQDDVENFTSGGGSGSGGSSSSSSPKQAASKADKSKATGYENSGGVYRMIGSSGDWLGMGKDIYPYAPVAL